MARNGDLIKAAKPHLIQGLTLPQFTKFVHIGHSFGSAVTHAFQAKYPELTDGSIQTGWLVNTHFGSYGQSAFGYEYAREWDPVKFGDRGSGYIVTATRNAFQQLFFAKDLMDPKMLDYGNSIKQPGTVGEGGPTATIIGIPAANFTGPQLVSLSIYYDPSPIIFLWRCHVTCSLTKQ